MDDGWFGDKYPRDGGSTSLGDWVVCKKKLPQGIEGLIASAKKCGIKFGLWLNRKWSIVRVNCMRTSGIGYLSGQSYAYYRQRGDTDDSLTFQIPRCRTSFLEW